MMSVKSEINVDMSEVVNEQENTIDADYKEVAEEAETAGRPDKLGALKSYHISLIRKPVRIR